MAMRWIVFLFLFPVLLASDKVTVKNLELKILNGAKNGAGYASIYNGNAFSVTLYKVEVQPEVFDRVELHDHVSRKDENGTQYMKMIEIPEMEIAPGATLFLQPGGKHLMLIGIQKIFCGCKKLTFEFFFRTGKDSFGQKVVVDVPKGKRCGG